MVGHNLPPDWDSVNVSENLGKAAALPLLALITPLKSAVNQTKKISKKPRFEVQTKLWGNNEFSGGVWRYFQLVLDS